MRLRSPLFAPADQPRKILGAIASEADCVILDLEDSVAEADKAAARRQAADILRQGPRERLIVRVNAAGTAGYLADLACVCGHAPAAIMLPKACGAADILALHHQLQALEAAAGMTPGQTGVLPIVSESAAAVLRLHEYAGLPRLLALCFGAEDLSADLGILPRTPSGALNPAAAHVRAQTLLAAAAAGLPALETPYPDHRDADGCARAATEAARDGFSGMMLIHPSQIASANAAFSPDAGRLAWARRVIAAARDNPGVFALDGSMIDRPHLRLAARLLAAAGEAGQDSVS